MTTIQNNAALSFASHLALPIVGNAIGSKTGALIVGAIGNRFVPVTGYAFGKVIGAGLGGAAGAALGEYITQTSIDQGPIDLPKILAVATLAGTNAAANEIINNPILIQNPAWAIVTKGATIFAGRDGTFARLAISNLVQGGLYRGLTEGVEEIFNPLAAGQDVLFGYGFFHGSRLVGQGFRNLQRQYRANHLEMLSATEQTIRIAEATAAIQKRYPHKINTMFILGSGLGDIAQAYMSNPKAVTIPYRDIPHFSVPTVSGHSGNLILLELHPGFHVACLQGRSHFYETRDMFKTTFATRVVHELGAKRMLVTNAAGAIDRSFKPGDLMIIDNHINQMGTNPLMGQNLDQLGPRFPDMTHPYSKKLRDMLGAAAERLQITLKRGVYLGTTGPSYESAADIVAFEAMKASSVGMSTVPEVIVANHMKMEVVGVSIMSNMAAGILNQPLDHSEVEREGKKAGVKLAQILTAFLQDLSQMDNPMAA